MADLQSRAGFLLGSLSGLTVVAKNADFFGRALAQAPLSGVTGPTDDHVLVLINLQGGNDGLNCVVPYSMPQYYKFRPKLGVAQSGSWPQRSSRTQSEHEVNLWKKAMFDKGQVAVIQGVGYPKPDHSHLPLGKRLADRGSRRILGHRLDRPLLRCSESSKDNLFNALAVSPVLPELFGSRTVDVPAIDGNLRGYGLASDRKAGGAAAFRSMLSDTTQPFNSPYLGKVAEIEANAQRGSEELPKLVANYKTDAQYPATNLGRSLALAAQMIGSQIGTRIIYVAHGSFDTHTNQKATQDRLLEQFSDAVSAFYTDLASHGNDKRVTRDDVLRIRTPRCREHERRNR